MTTQTRFGLGAIGQIAIVVHDLAGTVAFYRDALGLRHLFDVPGQMAFFDCGGVRLMLSLPESPEYDHPASILYFRVEDIRGAFAELSGRGVAFEGEPHRIADMGDHELWMAFFRDPESNVMALMSEVPKPGA